ncbi:11370_t:CDS:1 [Funneliformis mosseae]|uniref:11370_t:CDS:1 n=1 Tax=Funneliformis mosseae TaxID=27381 RepID=A0A9N9HE00_FUNMO|nr:11370_t:CDS:1 [Funneliformis mosseae]
MLQRTREKEMSKLIRVAFLVIPTGTFFGYDRCQVIGISIEKDAPVTALESQIQKYHLDEKFRNASFSLRAIDYEAKTYRDMKSEDKVSDYFAKDPSMFDKHIHILVVSAVNEENKA